MKQWADSTLPKKSVDAGWETLKEEFLKLLEKDKKCKDHDDIFDNLKRAVAEESLKRHHWEDKAPDVLRVIQLNALEDRIISDKSHWESTHAFLDESLKENIERSK